MLKSIEFSGKSLDDAIENAVKTLQVEREDLSYEVKELGKKGFLGIGASDAKIVVSIEMPDQSPAVDNPVDKSVDSVDNTKTVQKPEKKQADETPRLVKAVQKTEKPKPVQAEETPKVVETSQQPRLVKAATGEKPAQKAERTECSERPQHSERPERAERAERAPQPPREYPKVAPMAEELIPETAKQACAFVDGLMAKMGIEGKSVVLENTENTHLRIELLGPDMGMVIGRRGDTLDAIQYVTSLVVNKNLEDHIRLTLDTENYRIKRAESLERLARKMAMKVTKYHRPMTLEPMNPYERRIIHSALQEFRGVTTYSTGTEPNRRVVIAPEGAQRRPSNRKNEQR